MRVAMISGASRGIGLAIARELLRRGHAVSLGIRTPSSVPDDMQVATAACLIHRYDAGNRTAHHSWIAATMERFGRIDSLINNAGIAPSITIANGTDEALDEIFEINVKAPFRLIQAAMPHLKVSGQGRVINIASLSGKRVYGLNAGYQMSKHALVALTHAVRRAGFEYGIRASALCPGYVATDLTTDVIDVPRTDMTDPADIAILVATLIDLPNTASVAELLINCRYESLA
jgi:NAD(P)-dependent dehydrogenase (short-subunit alcohol dehydrogenase family)